jgi:hypothetical protein
MKDLASIYGNVLGESDDKPTRQDVLLYTVGLQLGYPGVNVYSSIWKNCTMNADSFTNGKTCVFRI